MTRHTPELVRVSTFLHPLTRRPTLTCEYGDITQIAPERDPRVPAANMPDTIVDPTRPGYGYTGRLLHPGHVILLAAGTREQIERWQTERREPWPYGAVHSSIAGETLTIRARNGEWDWQLHPAHWPEQGGSWYIGLRTRSAL